MRSLNVLTLLISTAHVATAQTPTPPPSTTHQASAAPTEHISSYLGVAVYPSKGQTSQQQTLDEKACFDWAKAQTGLDPTKLEASPPQQAATDESESDAGKGSRARGAVRGAAAGAAIGAIAGDTGKGAAIGATAGTVQGGRMKREAETQKQNEAKAEQEKQQAAAAEQIKTQKQTYNNAFATCLTGKGYAAK